MTTARPSTTPAALSPEQAFLPELARKITEEAADAYDTVEKARGPELAQNIAHYFGRVTIKKDILHYLKRIKDNDAFIDAVKLLNQKELTPERKEALTQKEATFDEKFKAVETQLNAKTDNNEGKQEAIDYDLVLIKLLRIATEEKLFDATRPDANLKNFLNCLLLSLDQEKSIPQLIAEMEAMTFSDTPGGHINRRFARQIALELKAFSQEMATSVAFAELDLDFRLLKRDFTANELAKTKTEKTLEKEKQSSEAKDARLRTLSDDLTASDLAKRQTEELLALERESTAAKDTQIESLSHDLRDITAAGTAAEQEQNALQARFAQLEAELQAASQHMEQNSVAHQTRLNDLKRQHDATLRVEKKKAEDHKGQLDAALIELRAANEALRVQTGEAKNAQQQCAAVSEKLVTIVAVADDRDAKLKTRGEQLAKLHRDQAQLEHDSAHQIRQLGTQVDALKRETQSAVARELLAKETIIRLQKELVLKRKGIETLEAKLSELERLQTSDNESEGDVSDQEREREPDHNEQTTTVPAAGTVVTVRYHGSFAKSQPQQPAATAARATAAPTHIGPRYGNSNV